MVIENGIFIFQMKKIMWLSVLAHDCNPSTWEDKEGGSLGVSLVKTLKTSLVKLQHGKTPSLLKIQNKISQVWLCMPVISHTQGAKAGESVEPRK